jgi:hypothetical protein
MTRRLCMFILYLILLSSVTPAYSQDDAQPINVVVAVDGNAQVHRATWEVPNAMSYLGLGELIFPGDIIEPSPGQQVHVLCADLTQEIVSNVSSSPCSPEPDAPVFVWADASLVGVQRADPARYFDIPYVITPRNTNLLKGTPTFQWASLQGAATYSLQISREDGTEVWARTGLTETELPYPSNEEPLDPGRYIVNVVPYDDGNFVIPTPEDPAPHSFVVLDAIEVADIEQKTVMVANVPLPTHAPAGMETYNLALSYARYELYADAIWSLSSLLPVDLVAGESFPDSLPDATTLAGSPELYLRLGDYYRATHLPLEAWRAYEVGLQIAEAVGDLENTAKAHAGLAEVVIIEEAIQAHYEAAIDFFCNGVSDTARCEELTDELEAHQLPHQLQ